MLLPQLLTCCA